MALRGWWSSNWKGAEGALLDPPAIAPDGRRIAIVLRKEGKRRIHVISADGAELQPVAPTIDAQGSTAWSPDGNWIATGGNHGIGEGKFQIPTAGGVHVRLTNKDRAEPDMVAGWFTDPTLARMSIT